MGSFQGVERNRPLPRITVDVTGSISTTGREINTATISKTLFVLRLQEPNPGTIGKELVIEVITQA